METDRMSVLENNVVGIRVVLKPKDTGKDWRKFIKNVVDTNHKKGNAFLYEYYEMDGIVHLHERFKDAEAYKKHFDFFSTEVAEEFFSLFDFQHVDVYGDVGEEVEAALKELNANFYTPIARF